MNVDRDPQDQVNWQLASQVLQQMLGDQGADSQTQEEQRMLALLQAQPEMALRLVNLAAIAEQQYQQQELQRRKSAEHQLLLQTQAILEQQAAESLLRHVPGFTAWQRQDEQQHKQQGGPQSDDSATVSNMAVRTDFMAHQHAAYRQQAGRPGVAVAAGAAKDKHQPEHWQQPQAKRTKVSHQENLPQLQQSLEGTQGRRSSSGEDFNGKSGTSSGPMQCYLSPAAQSLPEEDAANVTAEGETEKTVSVCGALQFSSKLTSQAPLGCGPYLLIVPSMDQHQLARQHQRAICVL
jgi:hypothetical protein